MYVTPNADADLGFGSSDDSKVTDMIKAGGGLTRFFAGVSTEVEPSLQYETDRHGQHRNLLFDGQAQYFGKRWRQTIAEKTFERYSDLVLNPAPGIPAPKSVNEIPSAKWGWQVELFAGVETGAALSNNTVKSSDKKTSVVLPGYAIARLRPRISTIGEYRRSSVNLSVTPRYLFAEENVTRELKTVSAASPTGTIQTIYVFRTNGWRVFGNGTFLFNLDPAGHFAWSVTYKVGSEPPKFNHVNIVETGLVLKY